MTLAINASDDFQIMLDDFGVSLDISDGDDPVNKIELTAIGGELKFSEHLSKVFITNRGTLSEVLEGDEAPVLVEFDLRFRGLKAGGQTPTAFEALTNSGAASGWISTRPAGQAYCLDVVFNIADPEGGTGEVITFGDFTLESIEFVEGNEVDLLSVKGRAFSVTVEDEQT